MNYLYMNPRQLAYKPVTAYTADRPILVNGYNINTGLYPVLNFKPVNAQYPFIYVPIAEFTRVGAEVVWDETTQTLSVISDYFELKTAYQELQLQYERQRVEYFRELVNYERRINELTNENEKLKAQLGQE